MNSYLFLLLLVSIFVLSALILAFNLSEPFYQVAIPSVAVLIGSSFVILQVKEAGKSVKLSAMPALNFDVKSGKTFLNKNKDQLSLADRLLTKIFIQNDSKFIIYCFIEIILSIKYKDGNISTVNFNIRDKKNPLVIFIGRVLSFSRENLLSRSLLGKSHKELNEEDDEEDKKNKEKFELQKNKIEKISAEFIIFSGPFIQESFEFRLRPLKWTFDLKEEVWLDPHKAKDYDISPLVPNKDQLLQEEAKKLANQSRN